MSSKIKALFSDFADHVREEVRSDDNPLVGVDASYDTPTHKYLIVNLKNVKTGSRDLYDAVESFRPGTRLKSTDPIGEGAVCYAVYIPLEGGRVTSHKKRHKKPSEAPLQELMFYVMGLMMVTTGAALTTTAADWAFLF